MPRLRVMVRFELSPGVHCVPGAIGCTTDHAPEAHCWKLLPPIQFHSPSVGQAPVEAPADGVVVVPDEAGAAAGAAAGAGDGAAAGAEVATAGADASGEATTENEEGKAEAMMEPMGMADATGDGGAAAEATAELAGAPAPELLEPELDPEDDAAVTQVPWGAVRAAPGTMPAYWTYWPGSGKRRSALSVEMQPLPMLARNIGGNVVRLVKPGLEGGASRPRTVGISRLLEPPVTVTGAQFMYISRLPTLLNQVQARVYWPGEMPSGTENWKVLAPFPFAFSGRLPGTFAGQPPMIL